MEGGLGGGGGEQTGAASWTTRSQKGSNAPENRLNSLNADATKIMRQLKRRRQTIKYMR